ncbi:MAG: hypothetical protein AVDCRST_MAG41-2320, partial [uncultured Corynebacteriales bacterium]
CRGGGVDAGPRAMEFAAGRALFTRYEWDPEAMGGLPGCRTLRSHLARSRLVTGPPARAVGSGTALLGGTAPRPSAPRPARRRWVPGPRVAG